VLIVTATTGSHVTGNKTPNAPYCILLLNLQVNYTVGVRKRTSGTALSPPVAND